MKITWSKLVGALLFFALVITTGAQTVSLPLSRNGAAAKKKAQQLSSGARISVVRVGADEEFGTFISSDQEGFTFFDVDHKNTVTLRYEEVKKIKDGYGGYNSAVHRHVDRRKNMIVVLVVAATLIGLIGALVAAK